MAAAATLLSVAARLRGMPNGARSAWANDPGVGKDMRQMIIRFQQGLPVAATRRPASRMAADTVIC